MKKILCLLFVLLFTPVFGLEITIYEQRTESAKSLAKSHKVNVSENVFSIAKKYSVSASELIRINKLKPPYYIKPGKKLKLPNAKRYLIRKGDTLYSVSRKYNVSVRDLATLNDLTKSAKLQAGKYINIPNVAFDKKPIIKKSKKAITTSNKISDGAFSRKKVVLKRAKNAIKQKQYKRLKRQAKIKTPKSSGRFIMPIHGKIISKFGRKSTGVHNDGINISGRKGSKIFASDNGIVAYVGNGLRAFGNMVLIKHDKKFVTVYAHLDKVSVKVGQKVKQKQVIGLMGNTGKVKTAQLHFQIRKKRQILNPHKYLR